MSSEILDKHEGQNGNSTLRFAWQITRVRNE